MRIFRDIKDFVPFVAQYHPVAPKNVVEVQLHKAAVEFCRLTGLIDRVVTMDAQKGVHEYLLPEMVNLVPWRLDNVMVNNCPYNPIRDNEDHLNKSGYIFEPPYSLYINPPVISDVSNGIRVEMTMIPAPNACELPEVLWVYWRDAIAKGAAASLHLMNTLDRSDPQMGGVYRTVFLDAVQEALALEQRQHSGAPITVNIPRIV